MVMVAGLDGLMMASSDAVGTPLLQFADWLHEPLPPKPLGPIHEVDESISRLSSRSNFRLRRILSSFSGKHRP